MYSLAPNQRGYTLIFLCAFARNKPALHKPMTAMLIVLLPTQSITKNAARLFRRLLCVFNPVHNQCLLHLAAIARQRFNGGDVFQFSLSGFDIQLGKFAAR